MTKALTEVVIVAYTTYFVTVLTGMHFIDKLKDKFMSVDEWLTQEKRQCLDSKEKEPPKL